MRNILSGHPLRPCTFSFSWSPYLFCSHHCTTSLSIVLSSLRLDLFVPLSFNTRMGLLCVFRSCTTDSTDRAEARKMYL
jgi:hypothetical protein